MLTVWCRLLQRYIGIIPSRAGGGVRGVQQASTKPSWPSVQTEVEPGTSAARPSTHSDPDSMHYSTLRLRRRHFNNWKQWNTRVEKHPVMRSLSPSLLHPCDSAQRSVTTSEPFYITTSAASDSAVGKLDGLSWANIIPAGKLTSRRWPDNDPQS